jgi:hypothetical protein
MGIPPQTWSLISEYTQLIIFLGQVCTCCASGRVGKESGLGFSWRFLVVYTILIEGGSF